MAHRAGQLGFPPPDHAGHHGLAEIQIVLVVAPGLHIEHRRLGPLVRLQGVGEVAGRIVDVDVLAGGDERRRAPALGGEILGDGGGEAAGVGEDRDRAFQQRLLGVIAAERAADTHPVPGIRDPQAVAADDIDPVGLGDGADLARVMDRDLLGDDDDLGQVLVHADQLGHPVAHAGGRQVHDADIERVTGIQPFADIVEDRNVARRGLQDAARPAGRCAEHDVCPGKGVAGRRDLPGFAAQDVQHANPVVPRRHVAERADAEIVGEPLDALLVHGLLLRLGRF